MGQRGPGISGPHNQSFLLGKKRRNERSERELGQAGPAPLSGPAGKEAERPSPRGTSKPWADGLVRETVSSERPSPWPLQQAEATPARWHLHRQPELCSWLDVRDLGFRFTTNSICTWS